MSNEMFYRYRCGSTGSPNFDTVSVDAHLAA